MRPRPVDLTAAGAASKLFVINFSERFEVFDHLTLLTFSSNALQRRQRVNGAKAEDRLKRRRTSIVCSNGYWDRR